MAELKYVIEKKRRDKLVRELTGKFNSAADLAAYLTFEKYSEETGIRIPMASQERAYKRFNTMRSNDINRIEVRTEVNGIDNCFEDFEQSAMTKLSLL